MSSNVPEINEISVQERKKIVALQLTEKMDGYTQDKIDDLRTKFNDVVDKFIKAQKLPDTIGNHQTQETLARALLLGEHAHVNYVRLYYMSDVVDTLYNQVNKEK